MNWIETIRSSKSTSTIPQMTNFVLDITTTTGTDTSVVATNNIPLSSRLIFQNLAIHLGIEIFLFSSRSRSRYYPHIRHSVLGPTQQWSTPHATIGIFHNVDSFLGHGEYLVLCQAINPNAPSILQPLNAMLPPPQQSGSIPQSPINQFLIPPPSHPPTHAPPSFQHALPSSQQASASRAPFRIATASTTTTRKTYTKVTLTFNQVKTAVENAWYVSISFFGEWISLSSLLIHVHVYFT
jgi:hypothetical protein